MSFEDGVTATELQLSVDGAAFAQSGDVTTKAEVIVVPLPTKDHQMADQSTDINELEDKPPNVPAPSVDPTASRWVLCEFGANKGNR